jgi:cytochrome c
MLRIYALWLLAIVVSSGEGAQATALVQAEDQRTSGLALRVYAIGEPMDQLLPLVAGQTPNVSRVIPTLDLEDAELGGLEDVFLTEVDGWLVVPEAGEYTLRLISDDGSELSLDGKLLIDHDGLHGPQPKDARITLTQGEHSLRIRHFETYGGWALKLLWKRPGMDAFEVVPTTALACVKGDVKVTAPGFKRVIRPLATTRPGDGEPLQGVHPALQLSTARPDDFRPKVGGLAFLPDGRLLVSTWDPEGAVWIVEDAGSGDPAQMKRKRFAAGLAEPLGLCVVGKRVFVCQKQEITELIDKDGDDVADEYRCVSSEWDVSPNFHEFTFGLIEQAGWLYANLAIAIDPGGKSTDPQVPGRGRVIRVPIDGGKVETVAHGLRTPNGIGHGPQGSILLTDNQGDWLPSSKLLRLETNAFYGSRAVLKEAAAELVVTPPLAWLPQNEIGNSPSQPATLPESFGPYAGHVVHGDVTHGGLKRDVIDVVDGVWQASVFRFTQGLEAGVNRVVIGPDAALWVGGIGSTGNWGQEGKQRFGLQRLSYTGAVPFEMLNVRAMTGGLELEFTHPLALGQGFEPRAVRVVQWRYEPTAQYGGPKVNERVLKVTQSSASKDRTKLHLAVEGLAAGHVVYVRLVGGLRDDEGRAPWTTEAWLTLNKLPLDRPLQLRAPPRVDHNQLSSTESEEGFELLFDGVTLERWKAHQKDALPSGWVIENGDLVCQGGGGDLVTRDFYADFELRLDWQVGPGGNSGVFFHVSDAHRYVWETGPEMQILDNELHPDGRNPLTSAGANYALHAPARDATRPVGMWNEASIRCRAGQVEYRLNGEVTARFEVGSAEWNALVAASKFASMPGFGKFTQGRIALQDHGDPVRFRNLRIRRL